MIISSIACILYCNHLTSTYTGTNEKSSDMDNGELAQINEEQQDLPIQILVEERAK